MRDELVKRLVLFDSELLPVELLSFVCFLLLTSLVGDFREGDELLVVVTLLDETLVDSDVTPPDARRSLEVVVVVWVVALPSVFLVDTVLDHLLGLSLVTLLEYERLPRSSTSSPF